MFAWACQAGAEPARPAPPAERTDVSSVPSPTPSREAAPTASAAPPRKKWPRKSAPDVSTDWCTASVRALDEETCFHLTDEPTDTLLVYLHGIVPPTKESPQKTNFEAVVANASRRARAAALLPRGEQGLAGPKYKEWWGWPTGEPGYRAHGARLVAKIAAKRRALEDIVGVRFARVYLAGSSAGAYFVAALALHGAFEAHGFGAMSGGSGWRTPELAELPPKPFYVGYGSYDTVASSARALGELMRAAGWPVRIAEHPLGHGAKEIYLDEAFAFWREH